MGVGRISLLIDSPFRDMLVSLRGVEPDARKHLLREMHSEVFPIWQGETAERAVSKLQQRSLVSSARVGVTARNVFLRSGAVGATSKGTPVSKLAKAAEFGADPNRKVQTSRKGTKYDRRLGGAFPAHNRKGHVVYPAAAASIARIASLAVQTYARALLDGFDRK